MASVRGPRGLTLCSTDGTAVSLLDGNRGTLRCNRKLSGSVGVARASILAAINSWPVSVRVCERLWERPQNNGLEQTRSAIASASWAEPRPLQLNPVLCGPEARGEIGVWVGGALLAAAAAVSSGTPAADSERTAILEAAVRWGVTQSHVAASATVFLQIEDGDPPEQVMARFHDIPNLRPVSDCPHVDDFGRPTPKPPGGSIVLSVWKVRVRSHDTATAWVGHSEGPQSGQACEEYFQHFRGVWHRRDARANEGKSCGIASRRKGRITTG